MTSKRIKTRELLRSFKTFKDLLKNGHLQHLYIDIDGDRDLELSMQPKQHTGEQIAAYLRAHPKPVTVQRTHIFDELLRSRHRS